MSWWSKLWASQPVTGPAKEALEAIKDGDRQLEEARSLHREAKVVGESLAESHARNHLSESIEAVLRMGTDTRKRAV